MVWASQSQHVYPCPSQPYWVEPKTFSLKHSEGPQEQKKKKKKKPMTFESKQQFFIFSFQDVARVSQPFMRASSCSSAACLNIL